MSANNAQIVVLPRVMDDGSLMFDPAGYVPMSLPLFRKEGERFYPDFKPCKYRVLGEAPLTTRKD